MGDSYRPSRPNRRAPPLADRMTFSHGSDSYRPGDRAGARAANQAQFTFESHQQGQFPPTGPAADTGSRRQRGRTRSAQRPPWRKDNPNNTSREGGNSANGPGRRTGYRKPAPHERALLQHRDGGHEQTLGVAEGSNRFRNLDDLSDTDEADMDVASDSSSQQDRGHKAARTQANGRADGDSAPQWATPPPAPVAKWSNPDPYTALPPPSETTGVKKDVVQLIRKAKNQATANTASNNAVAANDDFISFGDDDDMRSDSDGIDDDHALHEPKSNMKKRKHEIESLLTLDWVPRPSSNSTPWLSPGNNYSRLARTPERWLHNEILDFQEFFAPTEYEHAARKDLVNRIARVMEGGRWFPQDDGHVLCFGSFPAGLYLPTADMDLVYASRSHFSGGPPLLQISGRGNPFKSLLYKAARRLENANLTAPNSVTVIANARVPILKFQDYRTGLYVDISFETLSGIHTQSTFCDWKKEYPDMIYLVLLVKQFLIMRGLNEVHTGGLGGFSVICLVVAYIKLAPPASNMGEQFMGFLEFYGKKFDLATQRIEMHPIRIVDKSDIGIDGRSEKPDGLSIQDPNKPENNISGGSRKAHEVFRAFAAAHDTLTDRMRACKAGLNIGQSILGSVFAGNYSSYLNQRSHLKRLGEKIMADTSRDDIAEMTKGMTIVDPKERFEVPPGSRDTRISAVTSFRRWFPDYDTQRWGRGR